MSQDLSRIVNDFDVSDVILYVSAFVFPPFPVLIRYGVCTNQFLLNVLLTLFFGLPGAIHALYVVYVTSKVTGVQERRVMIDYESTVENEESPMMSDNMNEDERRKPGRFAWVKRLIQSRNGSVSQKSNSKTSKPKENHNQPRIQRDQHHHLLDQEVEETPSTKAAERSNENRELPPQQRSVLLVPESIKQDNSSMLPAVSLSTMSVRSSMFSQHSLQSTSATVTSEHPTLFTNASTMGIPPASIIDRRLPGLTGHLYSTNNSSNHTFNTTMSPLSEPNNEH